MSDASHDGREPNTSSPKRNPATRLLEILWSAKRVEPNKSSREAWCSVFEIDEPDSEQALFDCQLRLVALRKLFAETELTLRSIPNINEELFIDPVTELAQVIDINGLYHRWGDYIEKLHPNRLLALKYAEDLLRQNLQSCEREIPNSDLQNILSDLDELYEYVAASSLPVDLKTSLLDMIEEIRRGIHEYRVRGASALKDALAKSVGILAANKQQVEENSDADEMQAVARMLTRIDAAYAFAVKAIPLLTASAHILPAPAEHIK